MSMDISTIFTKNENNVCGRKGYSRFKEEKIVIISPKSYGIFINCMKYKKRMK